MYLLEQRQDKKDGLVQVAGGYGRRNADCN